METLSPSLCTTTLASISKKLPIKASVFKLYNPKKNKNHIKTQSLSSSLISCVSLSTKATTTSTSTPLTSTKTNNHWIVLMETPPKGVNSKPEIIDYYVKTLERALGRLVGWFLCVFIDDPF